MNAASNLPFVRDLKHLELQDSAQAGNTTAKAPADNKSSSDADKQCRDTHISRLLLPASHRTREYEIELPDVSDIEFLGKELRVDRLNVIHDWLFVVGRPMPPRPLHQQLVMRREIVVTEQADLHLVWSEGRIFVKPLPRYLLDNSFWQENLLCRPDCICPTNGPNGISSYKTRNQSDDDTLICDRQALSRCANGFLHSYTSLVAYESDYYIAQSLHLLPSNVSWPMWIDLVSQRLQPSQCHHPMNRRYVYGELRLNRLNYIYRFRKGKIIRGYLDNPKYDRHMAFFRHNLSQILALGAYMVIILNAMQVGLATNRLASSTAFQRACYGFVVLALLGPLILLMGAISVFVAVMLWNLFQTRAFHLRRGKK